jgi:phage protein D
VGVLDSLAIGESQAAFTVRFADRFGNLVTVDGAALTFANADLVKLNLGK